MSGDPAATPPVSVVVGSVAAGRTTTADVIVVVDVIRAFTTAALLLDRGAREIVCVRDARQAHEVCVAGDGTERPLIVGEQLRSPAPGIDLPNSPGAVRHRDVRDRQVVMFTVNGTRWLDEMPPAATVLCASAVNVGATSAWILAHRPTASVLVVLTDEQAPEDAACAQHLRALLTGSATDAESTRLAVLAGADAHRALWGPHVSADYWRAFAADVALCADVDSVPIALVGSRDRAGRVVLSAGNAPGPT